MTSRVHVELEVSRSDSEPRPISLTAPADASAGAVLDVLGAQAGLVGASGAVQARSLVSGRYVDRRATLRDVGLLRGERLSLTVGLNPGGVVGELVRWPERHGPADDGRISLNRPPRAVHDEPALSVPVPSKRTHHPPRRFPLGAILIPVAIGAILILVVRRWEIALFALFTPVMVAWNYVEERRARADELREYGRTYDEEVELTFAQVRTVTSAWADWMLRHHPSPREVEATATRLTSRLWERHPGDPDFLTVRLGRGTRSAPVTLRNDMAGLAELSDSPDFAASAVVAEMPVTVGLTGSAGLAVVGRGEELDRTLAWLVAQVVALHSPADVLVAGALTDRDSAECWRWLPHVARGWIATEPVTMAAGADELLDSVARLAEQRRVARDRPRAGGAGGDPLLVVFVDGRCHPDRARLSEVLGAHDVGIVTVWMGDDPRAAPSTVSHLLTLAGDHADLVTMRGGERAVLAPEHLTRAALLDLSASLAPVRDAADLHQVMSVPDRVALDDLVPELATPAGMRRRWEQAPITQLTARLGLGDDGPFDLELGPSGSHALVGGTTGSGKSELLQTMVASLAASYPPSRVGFLLVDYKGGAAFKDAMHLPHCVGVVTDLDDHLTHRVMVALDAEIKRREGLLAGRGARDLTELRRSHPDAAPGDLVIVVDEFATLAKEIPAFVEGVVDIAARGRSLGLRLVLATQRPAGVINDRIRANVGVRIALRVNDEADSMDVIDSREAAHIPRTLAGRAFGRVDRALTEFQSAFVGAPVREGVDAAIEARDLWGGTATPPVSASAVGRTVLEELVASAQKVTRLGQWQPPHVPWLPALAPVLPLPELTARIPVLPAASVVLGLADLPEQQDQQVVGFDLAHHQNMLVFGTSRSGKTTLLRTLAAGFIGSHGPDEVVIAGLDFAGHGLHVLEGAPQVAGIVGADDIGRVGRLLRRLTAMTEQRKRMIAGQGLTSFAELAERSDARLPRVLVLLDGYAGATAALERVDGGRLLERLERLIPDGPGVGLHFVVTADRRAAVPSSLTSVITTRLVLRMAERDDYALVGVRQDLVHHASMGPGRGFIQGTTEVQVAVVASPDPRAEAAAIDELAQSARQRWSVPVRRLARMPGQVRLDDLPAPASPFALTCGVGDDDVQPAVLDLTDGHALVAGPPRSGRTTALATLAVSAGRASEPPAKALLRTRRSPLDDVVAWDVGPVDATDPESVTRALGEVDALLTAGRSVLCLLDDVDSMPDEVSTALEELSRRGRDEPVRLVAAVDNRWAMRAYAGLVPEIRRGKRALLMSPDVELDGDLAGVRLRTPLESLALPGRGFLTSSGVFELVQVALPPLT
ncbi:MAG TPA: FtsK/SpoIIIE domain-containing protein [Nocardioides sp.]|jgi:S-DNA-T family DNA segregation ATPase FtsK/SpoIIIE|uniref:FtsK/SpoIIIE domain-containing protein n=1 Tax=Nocardioides sp. TaxID=35761 RepID=UPI002E2F7EEE|nr:FtsK/SpoIIIE domain-containing protein [Nocardioides sp.]HEX3932969.1 FtsK/SpoIIIE domain-containing protein [Nocardioides sp.]